MVVRRDTAIRAAWMLAWCCIIAGLSSGLACAQTLSEYQVKAAFLYNFARFVDWPEASAQNSFDVCILGENPFGEVLEAIVKNKVVGGRPVLVRRLQSGGQARSCKVLFVSASERTSVQSILESLAGSPVLTVGETPGFATQGGVINFIVQDEKVRFEVNVDAADRARLKISSKLLNLARIIKGPGNRG